MHQQLIVVKKIAKTFLIVTLLLLGISAHANEVALYNSDGDAVAYIDFEDEKTIYLWTGEPVAYLEDEDVYGFNGKHLGWFTEGVLIGHKGDAPCVTKDRHPSPNYESYKSYKSYKPYKSYTEYAPYKPYTSNKFSNIECKVYLGAGIN